MPGSIELRTAAMVAYDLPKWTLAAPVVGMPASERARQVLRAIVASRCSRWCTGRFFADRVEAHPRTSMAIHTSCSAAGMRSCQAVVAARRRAARVLGFMVCRVDEGVLLEVVSEEPGSGGKG